MKTALKYLLFTFLFPIGTACEFDLEFDWDDCVPTRDTVHCAGDFYTGDTYNCIAIDLYPDIVIKIPDSVSENQDSISILDNGIYDITFKYEKYDWLFHKGWIIPEKGVQIATRVNVKIHTCPDVSDLFGFGPYDFGEFACRVPFGEELCEAHYEWISEPVGFALCTDEIYDRVYIPVKKDLNGQMWVGWIKMDFVESKDSILSNNDDSYYYHPFQMVIDQYAMQKPE